MDEKGGFDIRNWNFASQAGGINSDAGVRGGAVLGSSSRVSEHQSAFLKMGPYPIRRSVISEADAEASDMDFAGWLHQRNFLSPKAGVDSLQASQTNAEMELPEIPMVLDAPAETLQNPELETKNAKIRKRKPSTKKSSHVAPNDLKPKQSKKGPSVSTAKKTDSSLAGAKREKRNPDADIHGMALDFSHVPAPVCSCTGIPHQCYRWGAGGWQSSCCTTSISEYPLPMSLSRPGARLAGRKMSNGAYVKLLQRLAAEDHDLSSAVDLKNHWARHGTNKFVTIR